MHLTRQAIAERAKAIDVFIELLDARLPASSANPMLAELTAGLPTLKVINKQDLADPQRTSEWLAHYNAQPGTQAFALSANPGIGEKKPIQRLREACFELAPNRGGMVKPMRVLIGGVPNVGKSTLINSLVGRKTAKTGDEAGITRHEQRFTLADDFYLYDTPGMLWPRIAIDQSGYLLAASGAVGKNAYDEAEVALELVSVLQHAYPAQLQARYRLSHIDLHALSDEAAFEAVAVAVGATSKGGHIDWHKAAQRLITDFRTGLLGHITLETPAQFAQWQAQATERDAQRNAAREAQKALQRQQRRVQAEPGGRRSPLRTPKPDPRGITADPVAPKTHR
jgi:ribosome biogenesis GTPase A